MLYIIFVSRCLNCCCGVGFLHTCIRHCLSPGPSGKPAPLSTVGWWRGGGLCMGFLGAGVLRWGGEASEGCSGPRPVCRRDHVLPGGDLLLPDWGLCPWDLCLL